jgi:hypothetical protein
LKRWSPSGSTEKARLAAPFPITFPFRSTSSASSATEPTAAATSVRLRTFGSSDAEKPKLDWSLPNTVLPVTTALVFS